MESAVVQMCFDRSWEKLADDHFEYINGKNRAFSCSKRVYV